MNRLVGLLLLVLLNFGCATIFISTSQTVHVDSEPQGVTVQSNKLNQGAIFRTPASLSFQKGGKVSLDLSKEGYVTQSIRLNRKTVPSFWMNLLWFGFAPVGFVPVSFAPVGMLLDAITGAMWNYQEVAYVKLEKKEGTPVATSLAEKKAVFDQPNPDGVELDIVAPSIRHDPLSDPAISGKDLTIAATITDNLSVSEAAIFYRHTGTETYSRIPMHHGENNIYSAIIPREMVILPAVEYYIQAEDRTGNIVSRGFAISPLTILVKKATTDSSSP